MHISYDRTVRAGYIQLRKEDESSVVESTTQLGNVFVDFGPDGKVVGIEVHDTSEPTLKIIGKDATVDID